MTKLVTILSILFALVTQCLAHAQPLLDSAATATNVAVIDSYRRELQSLYAQGMPSDQRAVIATSLKERLPTVKAALRSLIEGLKSQDKWTADFDTKVEEQIARLPTRKRVRETMLGAVREMGGARAAIEYSLANLDSLPKEIDADLARKPTKTSWLMNVDIIPSAQAKISRGAKCAFVIVAGLAAGAAGCEGCAFGAGLWLVANCL